MKRKILLLSGSFILLLFAFGVYQLFVPGIAIFDPKTRGRRPDLGKIRPGQGPHMGETSEIRLVARNAAGQLRGIYKVASWTKEDDDSFTLVNPTAVVYLKDGARTYVSADHGRIWASEVPGGIDIRHGYFKGNVKIYFDQSKDLNRKHPAQRNHDKVMEECISVFTNDLRFSRDMLEVKTDSRVVVWSKMIDIVGQGLVMRWNEEPRELRLLRIEKGEVMAIKDLPEEMNLLQMTTPESTKTPATTQPVVAEAKQDASKSKPAKSEKKVAITPPAQAPAAAPERGKPDDDGFGVVLTTQTARPRDLPDVKPRQKDPTVRNKYKATFSETVRVHSGTQKLSGSQMVAILFEWDELSWRKSQDKKKKTAKSQPTSQPGRDLASAERETRKPSADKRRLEIYWDGPLDITPVGTVPVPDPKRFKIVASGERIVLGDTETNMTCICSEVELQNPETTAFFRGNRKTKRPVYLTVSGDELVVCDDHIRCEVKDVDGLRNVRTFLVGAGAARTFSSNKNSLKLSPDELDEPEQNSRPFDKRISWGKNAEVILDMLKNTESGRQKTRPIIRRVIAQENVEVIMMPRDENATEITNYIKCGKADVEFDTSADGKPYWKKARATGNIASLMGGNAITAKEATVFFKPPAKNKKKTPSKQAGKNELIEGFEFDTAEVSRVIAKGDIRIWYKDPANPQQPESRLEAETLDALLDPNEAGKSNFRGIITGEPAKVWQAANAIEGNVIQFNSSKEVLQVSGAGKLNFTTDRDLNGNKLDSPRLLNLSWSRSLLAYGQGGYAIADGDVNLISKGDILQCNQARLFFRKKKAIAKVADTSAGGKKADKKSSSWSSLGAGMPSFSEMVFTQIEAHGGMGENEMVLMQSRTMHPLNPAWLQRRIELRGETLIFKPPTSRAESKGKGTLLIEDYRHPEKKAKTRRSSETMMSGKLERPSQTCFKWKDRMNLDQENKHVTLWGDVTMMHRSGRDVLKLGREETEPWGKLKTGRTAYLGCNRMDAYFDEPVEEEKQKRKPKDASKGIIDSGPQLGTLKNFKAFKDVTFKYDTSTIDGQSIEYFGPSKTLIIEGFLPGEKKRTNAHFEFTDPATGMPRSLDCPRIIIKNFGKPNESFKLDRMEGKGAR